MLGSMTDAIKWYGAVVNTDMVHSPPVTGDNRFYYVIHGIPDDMCACAAYRRSNRSELFQRKLIKCPYCSGQLMEVDVSTKVELFRLSTKRTLPCQVYQKCCCCKSEVGIVLA